ncbi:MAG: hypothetical protein M0Z53_16415 [Thermaerobacter sp.]|nr:hypothetical protein [Thermaerobacter sp.]
MSPNVALTVIAVCLIIMTFTTLVAVALLLRLVQRLTGLERSVLQQVSDLQAEIASLMRQVRETSRRVQRTVQDVSTSARRVGKAAVHLSSWAGSGRSGLAGLVKPRPWWMSGIAMGWALYLRHRKRAGISRPPAKPTPPR